MPGSGQVLVVDDQPLNIEVLEAFLLASGYNVLKAYNGREAIELACQFIPDVIVLDIMMPGMDGYEVTGTLKNDPRTSGIPVALLTALEGTDEKVRGLDAGADDFLTKPVNREELLARVRSLIRLKGLQDRLGSLIEQEGACPFVGDVAPVRERDTVLVLEDDPSAAVMYKDSLELAGHNAVIARNGSEALSVLENTRPGLIIFDLLLPDIDGLELLTRIKGSPKTADVPVLIVSSVEEMKTKVKGIDTGADDYLVKPVNKLELLARVRAAFRKYAIDQVLKSRLDRAMKQSFTDALTGLYNRRYLTTVFEKEMAAARRYGRPLSLVMLDIDRFKRINDTFGHLTGDSVLAGLGRVIRRNVRACDVAVRYGGEEFVLLLPDVNINDAVTVAEKLRAAVECHSFPEMGDKVTVSAGVTEFLPGDLDMEDAVRRADDGLYRAKEAGRNTVIKNQGTERR